MNKCFPLAMDFCQSVVEKNLAPHLALAGTSECVHRAVILIHRRSEHLWP